MAKIENQVIGSIEMELPIQLTRDDLLARGDELARLAADIGRFEQEKKAAAGDFAQKIETAKATGAKLADEIRSKKAIVPVACDEHADFEFGIVRVFRRDSGEEVATRPMRPDERQKVLPLRGVPGGKKRDVGGGGED